MTRRVIQRPKQKKNVSRIFFFCRILVRGRRRTVRFTTGRLPVETGSSGDGNAVTVSPFRRTSTNLLWKNDYKSHRGDLRPFDSSQVPPVGLSLGNQVVSQMFVNCRQTNRDAVNEQTTTTKIWKRTFRSGRIVWKMSGESVEPLCAQFSVGNDFLSNWRDTSFVFCFLLAAEIGANFPKISNHFLFFWKKKMENVFPVLEFMFLQLRIFLEFFSNQF